MNRKPVFLFFVLCLFFCHNLEAKILTLAYVDFPPYEFIENGQPRGVLVTIVKRIFIKSEIPIVLKYLPFKRAYEDTKYGRIDGLFNFYKTEARTQFFDYTIPIIKNPLVIFIKNDAKIEFNEIVDLKGLTIGVMRGYTYGTEFDESELFVREPTNSHESNFNKLIARRIDAYPCDKRVGLHIAKKNNLTGKIKILPKPLSIMDGHIGFTKGKHNKVIHKINEVILEMKANGEIDRIIAQYAEDHL